MLDVFIRWPLLATVPAAGLALLYLRSRRGVALAGALAWAAYGAYEYGMKIRLLCSGECNIRVDLLLVYPGLLLLSAVALFAGLRPRPGPPPSPAA
jgi:hypothetical protein